MEKYYRDNTKLIQKFNNYREPFLHGGGVPSKSDLKILTVHLPDAYIDGLNRLVELKFYPNRSEAIRVAIRDFLRRELWERPRRIMLEEIRTPG